MQYVYDVKHVNIYYVPDNSIIITEGHYCIKYQVAVCNIIHDDFNQGLRETSCEMIPRETHVERYRAKCLVKASITNVIQHGHVL